jgi:hypothetical protein
VGAPARDADPFGRDAFGGSDPGEDANAFDRREPLGGSHPGENADPFAGSDPAEDGDATLPSAA